MKSHINNESIVKMERDIILLKRKNAILYCSILIIFAGFVYLSFLDLHVHSTGTITFFESVRTRQLTVEDQNGNDRIVISPTITNTKSRRRTDAVNGVLVMDEKGIDRTVLGAVPTFQNKKSINNRINNGVPYGIVFNDEEGDERGGFGYYSDRRLASLGMDSSGGEGIALFVAEDSLYGQKLGMVMNENGQKVYLGSNKKGDVIFNLDSPQNSRLEFIVDPKGHATVKYFDLKKNSEKIVFRSKR